MDVFEALAEPTRRDIMEMLVLSGRLSVSNIADNFKMSVPAISQHLKVLRQVELVKVEKQAQKRIYQVNPRAKGWVKKMMLLWDERFDGLDALLINIKKDK